VSMEGFERGRNGAGAWTSQGGARARGSNQFKYFQIQLNRAQTDLFQIGLSQLKKFEIKYVWKVFEIRNNFPYNDFLKFEMNFELKLREASMSWKQGKIDWNFLGTRILIKLGQQLRFYTLLRRKIKFQQKGDQKFEFLLKVEFGLISQ
jgi:hypothetical protein